MIYYYVVALSYKSECYLIEIQKLPLRKFHFPYLKFQFFNSVLQILNYTSPSVVMLTDLYDILHFITLWSNVEVKDVTIARFY